MLRHPRVTSAADAPDRATDRLGSQRIGLLLPTEPDDDAPSAPVNRKRHDAWRSNNAVHLKLGDARFYAVRVLDRHQQSASRPPQDDLDVAPTPWEARLDPHSAGLRPQPDDTLDTEAPEPRRRSRVPRPSAAANVGSRASDIGGDNVGFHQIVRDGGAIAGVADRVEQVERASRTLPIAEIGERPSHPCRGVRVLAAVLPDAG